MRLDILHIDVETFSTRPLKGDDAVGVHKYVECPQFHIQLLALRWNDDPVEVYDLTAGEAPDMDWFLDVLACWDVLKVAHNAAFELATLAEHFEIKLHPEQWYCTMVGAARLGLPFGLGEIAEVLNLSQKKDKAGDRLIAYFASPVKRPTKKDNYRTVNLPTDAPEMWAQYIEYNRQDVYAESELFEYLRAMPQQPEIEDEYWYQDQRINARGFAVDLNYIDRAMEANAESVEASKSRIVEITGISNPNSLQQVKSWLYAETGRKFDKLDKDVVQDLLDRGDLPEHVLEYLELRQLSSKTSTTKFRRARLWSTRDRRNHGTIQYYGANRTGRYAGRGIQPHNMPRTMEPEDLQKNFGFSDIAELRAMIAAGTVAEHVRNVPKLISVMIRPLVIAPPGKSIVSNDYSAIEARVLAWVAGEDWRLDMFDQGDDIYKVSYSKMFGVPIEDVTKEKRQIGKVAELALGYQGAVGAIAMMDKKGGIPEDDRLIVVKAWRKANNRISKLWRTVEDAATTCIEERRPVKVRLPYTSLEFHMCKGYLHIYLPSGRFLSYFGARLRQGKIYYYGASGERGGNWELTPTYGGSLVENIVQAIARDILADGMLRLEKESIDIVMHVHDEVVAEAWDDEADEVLQLMKKVMGVMPLWANGLPMKSAGYVSKFYMKD